MAAPMPAGSGRAVVLVVGAAAGASPALRSQHDVRIAMSAEQALELAAATPGPDLMIVDLGAPGVDAVALCRDLTKGRRTRSIPLVLVASPDDPRLAAIEEGEHDDLGSHDLLVKPVNDRLLLARVAAALAVRSGPKGDRAEPFAAGTMLGEHRVERLLGSGSFGDVYAAVQPLTGKRVAIKVLARSSAEPEAVARFVAEARAANRIRQRNIIDIYSFGVHEETQRHFFVMELLEGETLRELLGRAGRLSLAAALPIAKGIAEGLDAAHAAGVTHRDLKPDNVFLVRQEDGGTLVKLLDFGIAKLSGDDAAARTRSGVVLGTPRYMSPEQARGRKASHAADIYALGVMLHEILTGSPPFSGPALDVLLQHATDPPPPMSSVAPDLSPLLDAPVLAMLAKRPEDRPASALAAVLALAAQDIAARRGHVA
jgi:serine/threonine-protein kinase